MCHWQLPTRRLQAPPLEHVNRRLFLTAGASLFAAPFIPSIACANTSDFWIRDRVLWLRRSQGGEEFRVVFWSQGQIDLTNYVRLCYLLRDAQESQTVMMDVNLLNVLYGVQYWQELLLGKPEPLIINSGYRSPQTNVHTEGAARNSMHLFGRAADVVSASYAPINVARMASFFSMGGVGSYNNFTHIDSGRVRFWNGKVDRGPKQILPLPLGER